VKKRTPTADAIWTAFTEGIRFIAVPLVLLDLVTSHYPQLTTAFLPDIEMYVCFIGGMIVASSTLESYHRPGTYKRMLFGLSALAFVCLWMFAIFGGGVAEFSYPPYLVSFDMSKVVYIILIGLSLKGLLVVQTFSTYRASELARERKAADERAAARRKLTRQSASRSSPSAAFASYRRMEFSVTPDDEVGFAERLPTARLGPGQMACPICGHVCPVESHVCENCGAWLKAGKRG